LNRTKEHDVTGDSSKDARLLGSLGSADGKGVVRMADRIDAPVGDVWSAITDPSHLVQWWGDVEGDLQLGGEFRARVHASGWDGTCRVVAYDAPSRLLLLTREPDQPDEQSIEITLAADGDQTNLVWEERGIPEAYVAGYGAGIQVHVEDLVAHLAGGGRCDAQARMSELFPAYQALAAKGG
jgi:uncharacterized protein YndB with AHSA1/START domain